MQANQFNCELNQNDLNIGKLCVTMCLPVYNCPPTELNSHQSDDRAPTSAGKFDQGIYKSILHAPRNYTEHSYVKIKTKRNHLGHLLDHLGRMGIWKYHQRTNQPTYNTWVGLEMQPTHLKNGQKNTKFIKIIFGGGWLWIHWSLIKPVQMSMSFRS